MFGHRRLVDSASLVGKACTQESGLGLDAKRSFVETNWLRMMMTMMTLLMTMMMTIMVVMMNDVVDDDDVDR